MVERKIGAQGGGTRQQTIRTGHSRCSIIFSLTSHAGHHLAEVHASGHTTHTSHTTHAAEVVAAVQGAGVELVAVRLVLVHILVPEKKEGNESLKQDSNNAGLNCKDPS